MSLHLNRALLRPAVSRTITRRLPHTARTPLLTLRPTTTTTATRRPYSTEPNGNSEFDPDYSYNKPLAVSLAALSVSGFLYLLYKRNSRISETASKQARINAAESRDNDMRESSNNTGDEAVVSEVPVEEKTIPPPAVQNSGPEEDLETGEDTEESIAAEVHRSDVMQQVQENEMGEKAEEAQSEGAYNPETGEINWDCPCLGGMAHGPCGEEFKAAFSCFVYSEADPKGIDCVDKFQNMQDCFRRYPEYYAEQLKDEDESEAEYATHPDDREVTDQIAAAGVAAETQEQQQTEEQGVERLDTTGQEGEAIAAAATENARENLQ